MARQPPDCEVLLGTIRLAKNDDIPQLVELWHECFGDGRAYIENFYNCNFSRIKTPVFECDGRICGMLHLLPCQPIDKEGIPHAIFYMYAVGMTASLRGSGCMRKLMETVLAHCDEKDFSVVLAPANDRLVRYYRTYGFEFFGRQYRGRIKKTNCADLTADASFRLATDGEYLETRKRCLAKCQSVSLDDEGLFYALDDHRRSGGQVFVGTVGEDVVCALLNEDEGGVRIEEFCFTGDAQTGLFALFDGCDIGEAFVCSPHEILRTEPTFCVMAKGSAFFSPFYMNLLLD